MSCTQSEDHYLLHTDQLMVVISLPRLPCNGLQQKSSLAVSASSLLPLWRAGQPLHCHVFHSGKGPTAVPRVLPHKEAAGTVGGLPVCLHGFLECANTSFCSHLTGADVNASTPHGRSALHIASAQGHGHIVDLLLEKGKNTTMG